MKIETQRLIVRSFELSDKEDLCEYMLQRVRAEFESYPDFTVQKADQEIEYRAGRDEFFAIELKAGHKVIGNVYLGKRDFNAKELGYVLNENYQNKGYGTEACTAAIDYTFSHGVHRIFAECAPQNVPSWKLMEKCGLKKEAHFIKNVSFHNDEKGRPIYWDTYVYAILNQDEGRLKR